MSMKSRVAIFDADADPFFYPKDITVAATSEKSATISIAAGADFWCVDMMFYNGGATDGDLQIKLTDEGDVFAFMGNYVQTHLIFGDGKDPYTLSAAKRFRAGTQVSVSLKNTSATERTVQLVLAGYKTPVGYVPSEAAAKGAGAVAAVLAPRKTGRVLIPRGAIAPRKSGFRPKRLVATPDGRVIAVR